MPRSTAAPISRSTALVATAAALVTSATSLAARADSTLSLSGTVDASGLEHDFVEFEVPEGTQEIEIAHDDLSDADVLDWGLYDTVGFRGWGGGNTEPIVVGALAASRSYLTGPMEPGTWRVVIGKAVIDGPSASYELVIQLRDETTLAPQDDRVPYVPSGSLSSERRWYAGDLHVHSRESGDARPSIDEVVAFARSQGLDFVELSDHNTTSQLDFIVDAQERSSDVLILPGVEWTSYAGHANGIGATAFVDHKIGQPGVTIDAVAEAFRAQSALVSINHPNFALGSLCIGCSWEHSLDAEAIDAVEIVTAGTSQIFGNQAIAFWDALCDTGRHVAPVGGSDDHRAGVDVSAPNAPIGTPTTMVLASELSHAGIVEGIRSGRTVVKVLGPASPMVELDASRTLEGDTVKAASVELTARVRGARGMQAVWVKNGVPEEPLDVTANEVVLRRRVSAPASGQDRYRIEVYADGARATVTSHLWVEDGPAAAGPEGAALVGGGGCAVGGGRAVGASLGAVALALGALGLRRRRRSVEQLDRALGGETRRRA